MQQPRRCQVGWRAQGGAGEGGGVCVNNQSKRIQVTCFQGELENAIHCRQPLLLKHETWAWRRGAMYSPPPVPRGPARPGLRIGALFMRMSYTAQCRICRCCYSP